MAGFRFRHPPMPLDVVTIFTSTFLLFLVQPMMARKIVPWFGGSATVRTTCLVLFKTALLAGCIPFRRFLAQLHRSNDVRPRKDDEHGALRGSGRSGYREYPQDRQQCSASFLARPCARNVPNGTPEPRF